MVGIFDPACELLPLYILSDLLPPPPPLPKLNVQYIQKVCLWVLNCIVDHILQEFYTLFVTRFGTYKIASPPQTKMTSKDDIKGLMSLKFLRPCLTVSKADRVSAAPVADGQIDRSVPLEGERLALLQIQQLPVSHII
jgi:hypothetical protein